MNGLHRWYCRSGLWKTALCERILPWALEGAALGGAILEVGPGPGLTTDMLRGLYRQLAAVEIDRQLAASLGRRLAGTHVSVIAGDATALPFADGAFSGAVSFTMLHHVPSPALQDRLLAEVYRVLQPGGLFVGTDSRWSSVFQLVHHGDTMVIVDPDIFGARLAAVGFTDVSVDLAKRAFRFRARRA